jgi:hypothetical protein
MYSYSYLNNAFFRNVWLLDHEVGGNLLLRNHDNYLPLDKIYNLRRVAYPSALL